jgi:hypothetical protein
MRLLKQTKLPSITIYSDRSLVSAELCVNRAEGRAGVGSADTIQRRGNVWLVPNPLRAFRARMMAVGDLVFEVVDQAASLDSEGRDCAERLGVASVLKHLYGLAPNCARSGRENM